LEHVHIYLSKEAKNLLLSSESNVAGIAYELGFEHMQSFSKLFKEKTSQSPLAFRAGFN